MINGYANITGPSRWLGDAAGLGALPSLRPKKQKPKNKVSSAPPGPKTPSYTVAPLGGNLLNKPATVNTLQQKGLVQIAPGGFNPRKYSLPLPDPSDPSYQYVKAYNQALDDWTGTAMLAQIALNEQAKKEREAKGKKGGIVGKLEAGVERLKKATLADYLMKGPLGIVDPKIGSIATNIINPIALQALNLVPGVGPILSQVASTAYETGAGAYELEQAKKEYEAQVKKDTQAQTVYDLIQAQQEAAQQESELPYIFEDIPDRQALDAYGIDIKQYANLPEKDKQIIFDYMKKKGGATTTGKAAAPFYKSPIFLLALAVGGFLIYRKYRGGHGL